MPQQTRAAQIAKRWRQEHPEKSRAHKLKIKYGISQAKFDAIVAAQNGRCALCSEPFSSDSRGGKPVVDHCHETGKIRGVLHSRCNMALGVLGDSSRALLAAVDYLECAK